MRLATAVCLLARFSLIGVRRRHIWFGSDSSFAAEPWRNLFDVSERNGALCACRWLTQCHSLISVRKRVCKRYHKKCLFGLDWTEEENLSICELSVNIYLERLEFSVSSNKRRLHTFKTKECELVFCLLFIFNVVIISDQSELKQGKEPRNWFEALGAWEFKLARPEIQ